jgi:membrane-associated progesterone receptor component
MMRLFVLLLACVGVVLCMEEACTATATGSGTDGDNARCISHDLPNAIEIDKLRDFTLLQLREFSGSDNTHIYVALLGNVYNVTSSTDLYGEGSPFHCYAGRDASLAISKQSCDEELFLDKPLEDSQVEHLSPDAQTTLKEWIRVFQTDFKYPIVGKVSVPEDNRKFTLQTLAAYTGLPEQRLKSRIHPEVLVCLNYKVFDVSYGGYSMYGVGKGYHVFAGKDASRALAMMSFEPEYLDNNDMSLLSEEDMSSVLRWEATFLSKYPVVGSCKPEKVDGGS